MIWQWCKIQVTAILILAYVGIIYVRDGMSLNKLSKRKNCNPIFDGLLVTADVAVFFDGLTACTVNLLEQVPHWVNLLLHAGMYVAYELFVALLFWYWVSVTVGMPRRRWVCALCMLPTAILIALTLAFLPQIQFLPGEVSNYSMGISVYICFLCIVLHCVLTAVVIVLRHREIQVKQKDGLLVTLLIIVFILFLQIRFPQALVSCIATVLIVVSIYLNMENPAIRGLEHYHNEMIMGFATLVENKDGNTGGHIRRSSAYAQLIARNLKRNKRYRALLTRDYIDHLTRSAPMHDIGKIGIPDAILQKAGRLTAEEFEIMKGHAAAGGCIIQETFGHLLDTEYQSMAYLVARHHHEKWNGKGYPDGLKGEQIPLCARIMAVADVFDAVSSKRCYRDAMPLEECYGIIERGRGQDFDPDVVDAFMLNPGKVEEIYNRMMDQDTDNALEH